MINRHRASMRARMVSSCRTPRQEGPPAVVEQAAGRALGGRVGQGGGSGAERAAAVQVQAVRRGVRGLRGARWRGRRQRRHGRPPGSRQRLPQRGPGLLVAAPEGGWAGVWHQGFARWPQRTGALSHPRVVRARQRGRQDSERVALKAGRILVGRFEDCVRAAEYAVGEPGRGLPLSVPLQSQLLPRRRVSI